MPESHLKGTRTPLLLCASMLALVGCSDGADGGTPLTSEIDWSAAIPGTTDKRPGREVDEEPAVEVLTYAFEGELCPAERTTAVLDLRNHFELIVAGEPLLAEDGARVATCEVTLDLRVAPGFRFRGPSIGYALESVGAADWEASHAFGEDSMHSFERTTYLDQGEVSVEQRAEDWSPTCAAGAPGESVRQRIRMSSTAHAGQRAGSLQLTRLSVDLGLEHGLEWERCASLERAREGESRPRKQERGAR